MLPVSDGEVEAGVLAFCNAKRRRYGFEPLTAAIGTNYNLMMEYGDFIRAALEAAARVRDEGLPTESERQ